MYVVREQNAILKTMLAVGHLVLYDEILVVLKYVLAVYFFSYKDIRTHSNFYKTESTDGVPWGQVVGPKIRYI